MVVADPEAFMLTACANGYGKRTPFGPNLAGELADGQPPDLAPDAPGVEVAGGTGVPSVEIQGGTGVPPVDPSAEGEAEPGDQDESVSSGRSYRTQHRGGKGLHDIKTTERNGPVIGIAHVDGQDEVMMISARGKIQRIPVGDISVIGRNTQGVRIMSLDEGDVLVAVKRVPNEEGNGNAPEANGNAAQESHDS